MYLDFKEERDKDFLNAYQKVITRLGKEARFLPKSRLIAETVYSEAQRYYVSYEQTIRIISRLLNKKKVIFKNPVKKEMYRDILNELYKRQKNSSLPVNELIAQIIYAPAPRFYISEKSASILFYTLLKNKKL